MTTEDRERYIGVRISPELYRDLRVAATLRGLTLREVLREALEAWLDAWLDEQR